MATDTNKKVKLISVFSQSHKTLMEKYFLPSIEDDLDIRLFESKSEGRGYYMDSDWVDSVLFKSSIIIKTIKENQGEIFIYSDVDIEFFRPFKNKVLNALTNLDIVCQLDDNNGMLCTGFFGIRSNSNTLKLWEEVYEAILKEHRDQIAFNRIIRQEKSVRFGFLPITFFGGGTFTTRIISSKDRIYIPPHPVMFHANYTLGIENKTDLLEKVRRLNKHGYIFILFSNLLFKSKKKHRGNVKIIKEILSKDQQRRSGL